MNSVVTGLDDQTPCLVYHAGAKQHTVRHRCIEPRLSGAEGPTVLGQHWPCKTLVSHNLAQSTMPPAQAMPSLVSSSASSISSQMEIPSLPKVGISGLKVHRAVWIAAIRTSRWNGAEGVRAQRINSLSADERRKTAKARNFDQSY